MVIRNTLKCGSCESVIITRTQVGHKDRQEHSFPCPKCGVHISYVLKLDQKKATHSFEAPRNAKWIDSEEGAIKTLTFSDEIPVPVDLKGFSPFIETFGNFGSDEEFERYRHDEGLRQAWVHSVFPYCERCMVHFEKHNWELFDKESPPSEGVRLSPANRAVDLYNALHGGFSKFTLNSRGKHDRIMQRLTLAETISPSLYSQLAHDYQATGKILKLWKEIRGIRRLFVENYAALQPLLQLPYWRSERRNTGAFVLSDKRFNALRQLYIDTFETLCRLVVLALGIEAIIHHQQLELPTKKGTISLAALEELPNANKLDFLKRYPIADLFADVLDTSLRNGIGHHSAHYEPELDQIVLYDKKDSGTIKSTMPYTEFCDRVLKLFGAFELAAMYHHTIHIFLGGNL